MKNELARMPGNIVFISGMHGCGKDTLIEDFMKRKEELTFDVIRYYKCEMTSFKINFERQPRRIAKYAIDFYRVIKLAIENPNSIIITDRCVYDAYCYLKAFYRLYWFREEEYEWIKGILHATFKPFDLSAINSVILVPSFEFIKSNLAKRQKEKGIKWHETDLEYCEAVYTAYIDVCILYCDFPVDCIIMKEEDREKRVDKLMEIVKDRWEIFKDSDDRKNMKDKVDLYKFHPSIRDDGSDGTNV